MPKAGGGTGPARSAGGGTGPISSASSGFRSFDRAGIASPAGMEAPGDSSPLPSTPGSFVARAGASTSPAGAISTVAATGSQTEHSRTVGAISRPHSGQIQWNMHPIYTQNLFILFRDTPYPPYLGTLRSSGFDLR